MVIIVISLLMENKSDNKNVNFPTLFYLGSVSNKFGAIDLIIFQLITMLLINLRF